MESTFKQRRSGNQIHDVLGLETRQVTGSRYRNPLPGAVQVERYREQELSETTGDCEQGNVTAEPTNRSRRDWMVADFIASDPSLFVYRRFGVLITRRLVMLQLELSRLERQWKYLDRQCRTRPQDDEADNSELESRLQHLLSEIDQRSEKYQKTLLLQSQICALENATPDVVTSLRNWYQGEHFDEEEYEYLSHSNDLVALAGREDTKDWLQKFLEKRFATWYPLRLQNQIYQSDKIIAYSEHAAAKLSRVTLTVSMLLLLVMAILVLGFMNSYYTRLAFASATIIVFAATLSLTSVRSADVIVATAGFASVMGAFLQKSS